MKKVAVGAESATKGLWRGRVVSHFSQRRREVGHTLQDRTRIGFYFGITSRASLLDITSRISLRFLAASSMASRDP